MTGGLRQSPTAIKLSCSQLICVSSRFQAPQKRKAQQEDRRSTLAHGVEAHSDVHQACIAEANVKPCYSPIGEHCSKAAARLLNSQLNTL